MLNKLFQEFSVKEVSVLADYLYLAETSEEGSGNPGSAWEELWKEFHTTRTTWAHVIDKCYQLHVEKKINSSVCFQFLSGKEERK